MVNKNDIEAEKELEELLLEIKKFGKKKEKKKI